MRLVIAPMREEHLEDAAELVTRRYEALRAQVPIMPPRYADRGTILGMLQGMAGRCLGVVAFQGSRMAGFILGYPLDELLGRRCAYSPEWANGAELGESRRIYEAMYTQLAPAWVADGCCSHAISMLGNDRNGMEGWHWMGFGMVAIDGIREAEPLPGVIPSADIRQARLEDAAKVGALFRGLERYMAGAPTFWAHDMGDAEEWLAKPRNVMWLAYEGGEAVGCLGMEVGHEGGCEVLQDEMTVSAEPAFVREGVRGKGIGVALLDKALRWAEEQGFARCAVDFESANTSAVRFWLRWFTPVGYSLLRILGEKTGSGSRR